jgi:putative SOS response-associated peptidase YedK
MCGRYALTSNPDLIVQVFGLTDAPPVEPRYNIAPTQHGLVVRAGGDGRRTADYLHWGLIPSWAKDPSIGNRMINARAESAREKPVFRAAFKRGRCLVPADAFYEWKKAGNGKQPYAIHMADGSLLAFAGLWEHWQGAEGDEIDSYTILTTKPNELMKTLHDRMPAIIEPENFDAWLDPDAADADALRDLLDPLADDALAMYPVSRHVNSPRNDDPKCLERDDDAAARAESSDEPDDTEGDQPTLFA